MITLPYIHTWKQESEIGPMTSVNAGTAGLSTQRLQPSIL